MKMPSKIRIWAGSAGKGKLAALMTKFGIISLMPEDVRSYHQELRLKLVTQFGLRVNLNVPAHVTVKYPFVVEDADEIEGVVQEFCNSQSKTEWFLQDFNRFINVDNYVVFMDVHSPVETRIAHARFLDRLRKINWVQWGQFDTPDLHYHVTLATRGITADNFESVWSFLCQQEKPNFKASFDNLALVQIDDDSRSIYRTYRFQS
jgi:2'-5' RNA ligase